MTEIGPIRRNNVNVIGNVNAPATLVFVHGFGTDQTAWRDVAQAFLADFRVVLLDNVGAGNSEPTAFAQHRYLNLRRYGTDLIEVCKALKLDRPILIGHSVGAMICTLAALGKPGLARKLALVGASPCYVDTDGYRGGFSRRDVDAIYSAVTTRYSEWADVFAATAMAHADKPELSRHFAETIKAIPPDRALTVLCSIFQSDHRADIARLDVPTLIVQTKQDMTVPIEVAEYLNRHIHDSQLKVIDAEGHLPHISAPAEVIDALRDFINS